MVVERVGMLLRLRMARATLLGPRQQIAEPVHDAAAVTPVRGTEFPAAIVVERAAADAQETGGFADGEKWVIGVVDHGILPQFGTCAVCCIVLARIRTESAPP
jgi:hypothetical protein